MASDYSDNKNGQKNRIYFWLKHEVWSLYEAALLFADINPDSVKLKNDLNKFDFLRLTSLKGITYDDRKANLDECKALLDYENTSNDIYRCLSGKNESDTPQNWIDLAISKQFTIPWLGAAIERGFYNLEQSEEAKQPFDKSHANVSERLSHLNQASRKFWANANPSDSSSHPETRDVESWLTARGYRPTLASKAATIIRPDWAPKGRKKEE